MTGSNAHRQESGVEWIGDIPRHWELRCLARSVTKENRKIGPEDSEGLPFVGLEHVESWTGALSLGDDWLSPEGQAFCFARGDLLFSKLRPYLAKGLLADSDGVCSTEFVVLKATAYEPRYLFYLVLTDGFVSYVDSSTYGAKMPRANWEFIGSSRLPIPPRREQQSIASFLDRETARIDSLIEKRRLHIERLDEYRMALITRTVTRGLPPEAAETAGLRPEPQYKGSGIEWFGKIPAHWTVCQLRRVLAEPLAYGANEPADQIDPDFPRYIRITDIDNSGSLRPETFRSLPPEIAAPYLLQEGDLLLARSGATVGKSFLYKAAWGTCAYAGYLIRARLDEQLASAPFVKYFTESDAYWQWMASIYIQATIQNVSADRYATLPLAVPPLSEQEAIVAFLDQRTTRIEDLRGDIHAALERLQEYRSALIWAAVTGKIDVRDSVPAESAGVG